MYKVIGSDQKIYGPISGDQIRQWQAEGRLNQATLVLVEGGAQWRPLSAVPEFAIPSAVPPPVSMPPVAAQSCNGMAIAALVLGICSNICCCFGFICGALGLVFSLIALSQHESFPGQRGRPLAMAGLVLSVIGLAWHCFLPFVFGTLPFGAWHGNHWRYL
jgi:hypothetical protein